MFRFYFKVFFIAFFIGFFGLAFGQKNLKNTPTVQKKSEVKAEYLFIKGENHFLQKNYKKALVFFFDAQHYSPKNSMLQHKIAECYFLLDNSDKAISYAKKAIKLNKNEQDFHLLLANIYLNNKEYENAIKVYENLLKNIKNSTVYYLDLAHVCQQLLVVSLQEFEVKKTKKKHKKIEDLTKKTLGIYDLFEQINGYDINITQQKQKLWLLLFKTDEAFNEGEKFLEHNPQHINFILSQSQLLYKNKTPEDAISYLEDKNNKIPNNTEIQLTLVEYYKANHQEEKATGIIHDIFDNEVLSIETKINIITFYLQREKGTLYEDLLLSLGKKIITKHNNDAKAYSVLGDIYYTYKKFDQAQKQYLKAVKIDNNHSLVWQQIIFIDAENKDYDNIILHSSDALKSIPNNPTLWLYKGIAHTMKKEKEKAIYSFESGVEHATSNPALSKQFYAQLGDLYNEVKKYEKSYNAYDKALEYDPNDPHVLNNYSYFLSLQKVNLAKAKSMSQHLIRMFPNEATYLDTHAWVLYMKKEYKDAKNLLERALEFTQDGTIIEHYGDVLFQLGEENKAVIQWKKAKIQGGTSELIDKKITDKILYEE